MFFKEFKTGAKILEIYVSVLNLFSYIIFGLFQCRYTLQYTYPYAYYMEKGARKQLVCNLKKNIECTYQFFYLFHK